MPKKAPAGAKRSKEVAKKKANYYNQERNKDKEAAKEFCNDLMRPTSESHVFHFFSWFLQQNRHWMCHDGVECLSVHAVYIVESPPKFCFLRVLCTNCTDLVKKLNRLEFISEASKLTHNPHFEIIANETVILLSPPFACCSSLFACLLVCLTKTQGALLPLHRKRGLQAKATSL